MAGMDRVDGCVSNNYSQLQLVAGTRKAASNENKHNCELVLPKDDDMLNT